MKPASLKKQFLEELEKVPIVQAVCEKLGVSRQTFYQWKKKDPLFAHKVEIALYQGNQVVGDYAEGVILKGIKNEDMKAAQWWLSRRHPKYKKDYNDVDPERVVVTRSGSYDDTEEWLRDIGDKNMEKARKDILAGKYND